jgi:Type II secretion system protein B
MRKKSIILIMLSVLATLVFFQFFSPSAFSQDSNIPTLCVNGIIYEKNNSLAIINGESYKRGDVIEGAKIVEITESAVNIEFNGATFSRELGQGCSGAKQVANAIEQTIEQANRQFQSSMGSSKEPEALSDIFSKSADLGELDEEVKAGGIISLIILVFLGLVAYIYFAITLQMVANKTSTTNSWLAWIPIGNAVLMCMIARRPLWWIPLIIILPVTIIGMIPAIIMMLFIFMDIAVARGKPKWLAALVFVPFVNSIGTFFYWGYLAFSSTENIDTNTIEIIPEVKQQKMEETGSFGEEPSEQDTSSETQEAAPEKAPEEAHEKASEEPKKGLDDDPPAYSG